MRGVASAAVRRSVGSWAGISTSEGEAGPVQTALKAACNLYVDRVTAEVVAALDGAGVPAIVLKGPSIARWLYPTGGRMYADTDPLVPASRFTVNWGLPARRPSCRPRFATIGIMRWLHHARQVEEPAPIVVNRR